MKSDITGNPRVLLIYPEFEDTFWSFRYALKFIRKKASLPPLGLLTVATMLPAEWKKRLLDLNITRLKEKHLRWADYVFISAMTAQRQAARKVIKKCKEHGITVVAGGPLFNTEKDAFPEVDHFVLNEAELTLPRFLEDLKKGAPHRCYETIEYPDIRQTPAPSWALADMKKYASMSIQASRGCPFDCEFCNVTALFGHRPRVKTADQIIAELDGLYKQGWRRQVFFVDDNFIGNKRYLKKELLPALIAWQKNKKGIPFYTEASINLADDKELMQMMVQAGFDTVFIGIETPSEEGLAECNKRQNTRRDLVECVKTIQRAGMQVQAGFIVGFDSDTPSIFERQIEFIQNSGIVTAMVGLLQAPPGTRLFERLKNEGRIRNLLSGDNVDGDTNIMPNMDLETLREGYRKMMRHLYAPKQYYSRVKTFLREYQRPHIELPLDFSRLHAFGESILRLGILGKERFYYWHLIIWTLFRRPGLFPLAVTLSIYGHHFRKTCELHIADA